MMRRTERGEGERGLRFAGGGGDQNQRKINMNKNEIRCNVSGPKNKEEKYIIYHRIIGISRQPNQGAVDDYFLPYHPKWWKRRGNYQPAADCWVGILMVIIAALMVYLPALSFPLSGPISQASVQINGAFSALPFYHCSESTQGERISKILKYCINHNFR